MGLGLVVYGSGSLVTAVSPNLTVLLIGWSGLEGLGAALIMPAVVALVAGNFPSERRSAAYGLIAAAGAIGVAAGPLIGGAVTTFASWRWVFAGEVVIVLVILGFLRKLRETPARTGGLRPGGRRLCRWSVCRVTVFALLRSGSVGLRPGQAGWHPPSSGVSAVDVDVRRRSPRDRVARPLGKADSRSRGGEPLFRPSLFRSIRLTGGLIAFFFQFMIQSGLLLHCPAVPVGGARARAPSRPGSGSCPCRWTLLLAAVLIPRLAPGASPRLVVRGGLVAVLAGTWCWSGGLDPTETHVGYRDDGMAVHVGLGPDTGGPARMVMSSARSDQ